MRVILHNPDNIEELPLKCALRVADDTCIQQLLVFVRAKTRLNKYQSIYLLHNGVLLSPQRTVREVVPPGTSPYILQAVIKCEDAFG